MSEDTRNYTPRAIIGGNADCLDAISSSVIDHGSLAFIAQNIDNRFYVFRFDSMATNATDTAEYTYVRPFDYSVAGVWIKMLSPYDNGDPVGSYKDGAWATAPNGYFVCDGSAKSRVTYAALFAAIGTMYGAGDGTTTFNIPDWRGLFPRCVASGSLNDPDRGTRTNRGDGTTGDNVGTKQADQIRLHTHSVSATAHGPGIVDFYAGDGVNSSIDYIGSTGGNETRPINMYQLRCIKY